MPLQDLIMDVVQRNLVVFNVVFPVGVLKMEDDSFVPFGIQEIREIKVGNMMSENKTKEREETKGKRKDAGVVERAGLENRRSMDPQVRILLLLSSFFSSLIRVPLNFLVFHKEIWGSSGG